MDTEPRTGFSTTHAVICACSHCRELWEIPARCEKCGEWCTCRSCIAEHYGASASVPAGVSE